MDSGKMDTFLKEINALLLDLKKNNVQRFIGISLNKNSPKCIFPCLYKEIISFLMRRSIQVI